jgi:AcrR family transcriptional regulator
MTSEVREQLTRDRIVRITVDLIERDGEQALSMRRVAAELGSGVMSLYNHVPNKEALLDGVAEFVLADLEFSPQPGADWRDQARTLVRSFREVSRRYPRCVNLVVTRQLHTPAGLRPLEAALATVRAAGFEGEIAVRIMRTFIAFALGSLVNDARLARPTDARLRDVAPLLDPQQFPNTRTLAGDLDRIDPDADFDFGVELLIAAVAALPR